MIILGSGLTGLICGCLDKSSLILSASPKRESNHKAVLRFRTNKLGIALGFNFKKVTVTKGIWYKGMYHEPNPLFNNEYSDKVTGIISNRSIFRVDNEIRYIPPDDFYNRLYDECNQRIVSGEITNIKKDTLSYKKKPNVKKETLMPISGPILSTLPMDVMAKLTSMPIVGGKGISKPIFVSRLKIKDCDAYSTVYYPDWNIAPYRATLNGDILIVESTRTLVSGELDVVYESLAINKNRISKSKFNHLQPYGKITEIDQNARKNFILMQTIQNNIYSIGRYATWRPKLMLDEIPEDFQVIKSLINDKYTAYKYVQKD